MLRLRSSFYNVLNKELRTNQNIEDMNMRRIFQMYMRYLRQGTKKRLMRLHSRHLSEVKAAMKINYFDDAQLIKCSVRKIQQNRVIILIKYTHGGFSIMRHLLSPLDLSVA